MADAGLASNEPPVITQPNVRKQGARAARHQGFMYVLLIICFELGMEHVHGWGWGKQ